MTEVWEPRFNILLNEYSILSSEHNRLKLSHERLKLVSNSLRLENSKLHKVIFDLKIQIEQKTRESKVFDTNPAPKNLSSGIASVFKRSSLDFFSKIPAKATTAWKTPQPKPDISIDPDRSTTGVFEAFFVIGIAPSSIKTAPQEKILFEFPSKNCVSKAMKRVMPNLAMPKLKSKKMKLSGSASDLNNLIFGQIPSKRNKNCFIFTLKSNGLEAETSKMPNSNHEVLYFTCLLIKDLVEHQNDDWIAPKCYCIASYFPAFELHYEILCSILFLKRLYRMDLMQSIDTSNLKLSNIDVTDEGIELLTKVYECSNVEDISHISIKTSSMDCLNYNFQDDISVIDVPWLCTPLFSFINFQDFVWTLSALLQEKSIIFVSGNLGLMTSCVLAMRALIRPFKSTNLTIPVIPDNLKELLEAPVPILAGVKYVDAKLRQKYSNIIWVLLDETEISHRIQCQSSIITEVDEIQSNLLAQIKEFYKFEENNCFERTPELKEQAISIVYIFKNYWLQLIDKFNLSVVNNPKKMNKVLEEYSEDEKKFIKSVVKTQMFMNTLED